MGTTQSTERHQPSSTSHSHHHISHGGSGVEPGVEVRVARSSAPTATRRQLGSNWDRANAGYSNVMAGALGGGAVMINPLEAAWSQLQGSSSTGAGGLDFNNLAEEVQQGLARLGFSSTLSSIAAHNLESSSSNAAQQHHHSTMGSSAPSTSSSSTASLGMRLGRPGYHHSSRAGGSGGHRRAGGAANSSSSRHSVPFLHLLSGGGNSSASSSVNCPICQRDLSTLGPGEEPETHLIMCLTRPRLAYNEDVLVADRETECAICLEEMLRGDTIARLPCLCIYHKRCIDAWFKRKNCCPEHPDGTSSALHLMSGDQGQAQAPHQHYGEHRQDGEDGDSEEEDREN